MKLMSFDLRFLFGLVGRLARPLLIMGVIPGLLAGGLSYAYFNHQHKTYQASLTLYVQQAFPSANPGNPSSPDIMSSEALAHTYSDMIAEPVITNAVDRAMAPLYPGYHLHGLDTLQSSSVQEGNTLGTQLVGVSVTDTNSARAAAAATAVAQVFISHINALESTKYAADATTLRRQLAKAQADVGHVTREIGHVSGRTGGLSVLQQQLAAYEATYRSLLSTSEQFSVLRDSSTNTVAIDSPATVAVVGPHSLRMAGLIGLLVLILGAGIAYLNDYLKDLPRSPEEIEELCGAPILGTVPRFDTKRMGTSLVAARDPRSTTAEAYRLIRTNIRFMNVDTPARVIVVTSSLAREGKSTTISNLAEVFSQGGARVTLVDADLRRPTLHRLFGQSRTSGLTSLLLNGLGDMGPATSNSDPNLSVINSGPIPPNPADLLASHRMEALVSSLRNTSEMVLIDSPPVIPVSDAALLATLSDGVILVVDPGSTKRRELRRARERIEAVNSRVLGIVVNRLSARGAGGYYYYYSHADYHYEYGSDAPPSKNGAKKTDVPVVPRAKR